jgi:Mg2+-importing ATPase
VDVAKEAADIILLDKSLEALHVGVLEGRRSFSNILKYILMGTSSNFGNMFSMAGASLLLPFLPLLPTQLLLNNFLYDLSQLPIPGDAVEDSYLLKPRRWNVRLIQDFMLTLGPVSSVFDFLTFGVLLFLFHAGPELFRTGWFVESLATQVLVIFIIRTPANPLRSRPSPALTASALLVVLAGLLLPFTPVARMIGFVPLPPAFLGFLVVVVATYLLLVECIKRHFYRKHGLA